MSRPRTKGATIGIHLPLGADAEVRKRAQLKGVSVARYIEAALIRTLGVVEDETVPQGVIASATVPVKAKSGPNGKKVDSAGPKPDLRPTGADQVDATGCAHTVRTLIGGGMSKCGTCGGIRGANGVWR